MLVRLALLIPYVVFIAMGAASIERRRMPPSTPISSPTTFAARLWSTPSAIVEAVRTPPSPLYRATRVLKAGHRLRRSDFAAGDDLTPDTALYLPDPATLVGRYVRAKIERGAHIEPAQVSESIDPALMAGILAVRVWLAADQKALASTLDVGWKVDVCDDKGCVIKSATVVAIECAAGADDACAATLAATPQQKQAFLDVVRKDKLTVIVSEPDLGG